MHVYMLHVWLILTTTNGHWLLNGLVYSLVLLISFDFYSVDLRLNETSRSRLWWDSTLAEKGLEIWWLSSRWVHTMLPDLQSCRFANLDDWTVDYDGRCHLKSNVRDLNPACFATSVRPAQTSWSSVAPQAGLQRTYIKRTTMTEIREWPAAAHVNVVTDISSEPLAILICFIFPFLQSALLVFMRPLDKYSVPPSDKSRWRLTRTTQSQRKHSERGSVLLPFASRSLPGIGVLDHGGLLLCLLLGIDERGLF